MNTEATEKSHISVLSIDFPERIQVGFDPITYPVTEGDVAMLRIVLDMAYTEEITVDLQTSDGSATGTYGLLDKTIVCHIKLLYTNGTISAPGDYTTVTMTVTFPPGTTEQTVNVPTIDDSDAESPESFTAMLSNPSPSEVVVINQPLATINVADNEGKII